MERLFAAPVAALFQAYTDPRQVPHWWGPRDRWTRVDVMDARAGGKWRFIHEASDGSVSAFRGVYREIVPGRRIVNTFEFEPWAGHVSEDTVTFSDEAGRTRLIAMTRFASKADRDRMLGSGMEQGARETWDRLAELVEESRASKGPRGGDHGAGGEE